MNPFALLRCPVCRARFDGTEAIDAPCRRCAGDLTAVRTTGHLARHARDAARRALAADDAPAAVAAARRAVSLVDCEQTRATLFAALYAAHCRANRVEDDSRSV